jgi:hypothetical protein
MFAVKCCRVVQLKLTPTSTLPSGGSVRVVCARLIACVPLTDRMTFTVSFRAVERCSGPILSGHPSTAP